MRVTFDSNILVYAVDRQDRRHAFANDLIARAVRGDCRQTLQSLAECFNVLSRKFAMPSAEARGWIRPFQTLFTVVAAEESDLAAAIDAVDRHHLPFWDAMLWATARRAGCRLLLSEDFQDGRDLGGLLFVNPFDAANRKLIDLALPQLGS